MTFPATIAFVFPCPLINIKQSGSLDDENEVNELHVQLINERKDIEDYASNI